MFKGRWNMRMFQFALAVATLSVSNGQPCLVFAQSEGKPFTDLQSQITILQGQVIALQTQVEKLQTTAKGATFSFAGAGQYFSAAAREPNSTFLFDSGVPGTQPHQVCQVPNLR